MSSKAAAASPLVAAAIFFRQSQTLLCAVTGYNNEAIVGCSLELVVAAWSRLDLQQKIMQAPDSPSPASVFGPWRFPTVGGT